MKVTESPEKGSLGDPRQLAGVLWSLSHWSWKHELRRNCCRDFTTFVVLTVTDRHRAANPGTPGSSMALKVWSSISQKHVQQEKLKIKNHINHKLFRLLTANTEICLCHYGNVSLFYKTAALSTRWTSVSPDWNVTCVRQTRNKQAEKPCCTVTWSLQPV